MSQGKAQAAFRQSVDGINSRDPAAIEAVCDPELETTSRLSAVEGRTYRGYAGIRDYLADLNIAFLEGFHVTIEEFVPAGGEKLVAVMVSRGRGRGSDVPIEQRAYCACEFRDDKLLRSWIYLSRQEALEAVGLGG